MSKGEHQSENLIAETRSKQLDAVMIALDLNSRDMDQKCGFKDNTFTALRSRHFPGEITRCKIEAALSVRIWSDEQTFNLRMACQRRYNFDPALLTKAELVQWVRKLQLASRLPPQPARENYVAAILAHLAPNPKR